MFTSLSDGALDRAESAHGAFSSPSHFLFLNYSFMEKAVTLSCNKRQGRGGMSQTTWLFLEIYNFFKNTTFVSQTDGRNCLTTLNECFLNWKTAIKWFPPKDGNDEQMMFISVVPIENISLSSTVHWWLDLWPVQREPHPSHRDMGTSDPRDAERTMRV